ncbi:PQQ-dependent sugar dehydrogenase [Nocardioides gilvus]|uniref:PQQ-dependent sugar dehydrogenase n=1 Tax=Nocardioides gilvus TaxID=1735589 RepID=UPI000D748534|nr:PQQ-dependent sugar dehydrogenase [Nocardioides gilvus]
MFTAHRLTGIAASAALALTLSGCTGSPETDPTTEPTPTPAESESPTESAEPTPAPVELTDTIATDLAVPWGLAFLPDGSALVTERDRQRVLHLTPDGDQWDTRRVATIDGVGDSQEGGLLGIAVSPTFADDQQVFLYLTSRTDNRVLRGEFVRGRLRNLEPVLTSIPRADYHDGGRIAFGPDGFLYVATGDAGEPELAQETQSLAGKILRINTDGEPAPGNPTADSPVWSLGHRNIQGLAWDDDDQLWASEFGQDNFDELNKIESGGNYGWPLLEGRAADNATAEGSEGFVDPVATWTTDEASPSGLAWADGSLWLGALRGTRLWQVTIDPRGGARTTPHFVGEYGRLRTVVTTPEGNLWVTTSNRDGRGDPAPDDDQIMQVAPGTGQSTSEDASPTPTPEDASPTPEDASPTSGGGPTPDNDRPTGSTP